MTKPGLFEADEEIAAEVLGDLDDSVAVHLWQTIWWRDHLSRVDRGSVASRRDAFSRLARRYA